MTWTPSLGRSLKFGIVALVAALAGCSESAKGPPKVELSEGKVTVANTRSAVASVNYRVTQGRPRAGQWYKLTVLILAEGNNRTFELYSGDGSGLSTKGTLQTDCTIEPPGKAWTPGETIKYQFNLYEGPSKEGRLSGVSNQADGQSKVP